MKEIPDSLIRTYALENAIRYNGSANSGSILSSLFAEGLEKSQIKEYLPRIKKIVNEINKLSPEKQKEELENSKHETSKREIRTGLPELPNAEKGKIITRFAPFPSGPLHIGNARTLILNDEYKKMYDGKIVLAIDDTIGSKEKPIEKDAYKLIEEGVKWLEVNPEKIIKKSDRIETYYKYAEELIKKGYMYVCDCKIEEIRELKAKGIECSCRQFHPEEQFKRWKKMFNAKEGSMCVRLKTDMGDSDPAFRDRIMFRISDRPHAITQNKYRVYPLLDFSWAIDDHLLEITHIIRGMELAIETRTEKFIWDIFGWKHPEVIYNGHLSIEGVKISKSKSAKEVKSGEYIGWNDPRTWSIQSLRDRGITPKAIREFIINAGIKKTNVTMPIEVLYTNNKKLLDEVPRYFFVENPVKIKIKRTPRIEAKIPLHPNGKLGNKEYITLQEFYITKKDFDLFEDGTYRLMHLLTFKSDKIKRLEPREFTYISDEPPTEKDVKFLHWVPENTENPKVEVIMPDGSTTEGIGEPKLKELKEGETVQFERFGFVRLHKKESDRLEFWFAHK